MFSSAYWNSPSRLLRAMANARVRGPSRPRSIMAIMVSLPTELRLLVTPIESPTVPKADTVSKRYSRNKPRLSAWVTSPSWVMRRTIVTIVTAEAEAKIMEMDRATVSWGIVRLKRFARSLPLYRLTAREISVARLVVFIPPPHEPGDAPINMRRMKMKQVALLRYVMGRVLNPAVRLVTD